jgi:hypothetical protein
VLAPSEFVEADVAERTVDGDAVPDQLHPTIIPQELQDFLPVQVCTDKLRVGTLRFKERAVQRGVYFCDRKSRYATVAIDCRGGSL